MAGKELALTGEARIDESHRGPSGEHDVAHPPGVTGGVGGERAQPSLVEQLLAEKTQARSPKRSRQASRRSAAAPSLAYR